MDAFVASATSLSGSRVIIIDARGNGGGSDAFVRDFLLKLTNQDLR